MPVKLPPIAPTGGPRGGQDDVLVKVAPMLEIVGQRLADWEAYLGFPQK